MPTSNLHNAPVLCKLVREATPEPKRVLDVGPGHGKYGVLLREYAGVERVDAVEMWEPYVADYRLDGIYDKVLVGDALELTEEDLDPYDLVFSVSSIEHMPKEPAIDFLRRCRGSVVVATPMAWMQEDHPVPTERHQSLWTMADFRQRFPRRFDLEANQRGAIIVRLGPRPEPGVPA